MEHSLLCNVITFLFNYLTPRFIGKHISRICPVDVTLVGHATGIHLQQRAGRWDQKRTFNIAFSYLSVLRVSQLWVLNIHWEINWEILWRYNRGIFLYNLVCTNVLIDRYNINWWVLNKIKWGVLMIVTSVFYQTQVSVYTVIFWGPI